MCGQSLQYLDARANDFAANTVAGDGRNFIGGHGPPSPCLGGLIRLAFSFV